MDRGACWVAIHRVAKSQTQLKQLSTAHTQNAGRVKNLTQWICGARGTTGSDWDSASGARTLCHSAEK